MESLHKENIAKYLKGEMSPEERNTFFLWLKENSENQRLYEEFEKLWKLTKLPIDDYEPDTEKAWERFKSKIETGNIHKKEESKIVKFYSSVIFKIAATLVLGLCLGYLIVSNSLNELVEIQTSSIETKAIVLPDGSKVWLNKNSKISYSQEFNLKDRSVTLSGEAFFEVKKTGGETFTIFSNNSKTEVLGTQFNVRAYKHEPQVQVTVLTGKVSFSSNNHPKKLLLEPGAKGVLGKNDSLVKTNSEYENEIAWKTKRLTFENTHLSNVLKTLEVYFETEISVDSFNILNCRFTGNFENPDLTEIMEVLSISVDLKYQKRNNTYMLTGKGCK